MRPQLLGLALGVPLLLSASCVGRDASAAPGVGVDPAGPRSFMAPDSAPVSRGVPGDTTWFGFYDEQGFAVEGERWTFDHGAPDALEGWQAIGSHAPAPWDNSNLFVAARWIADSTWDTENDVEPPVLRGVGSVWVGFPESQADSACFLGGLGYGDDWCQEVRSPRFTYLGDGDVSISMLHFNDTEEDYDYTRVVLRTWPSGTETVLGWPGLDGPIGLAPDHPESPPVGASWSRVLTPADFEDDTES